MAEFFITTPPVNFPAMLGRIMSAGFISGPDKSNISAPTAPATPKQWAKADTISGLVSGWAKAYRTIPDKTDINAEDSQTLGGWGGWIKMDHGMANPVSIDLNKSSPNYGDFSGYAWESDVVGWIKFNCSDTPGECAKSNYKVRAILPGAPLDVSCFADPNPANIGDGVVFTATPSGEYYFIFINGPAPTIFPEQTKQSKRRI